MQEAEWHNPEDDIGEPQPSTRSPLWTRESSQNNNQSFQRHSSFFPVCHDWSMTQTCQQNKDESVLDLKVHLEGLFLWLSGFHAIDDVT